jgi:hypothetical protein
VAAGCGGSSGVTPGDGGGDTWSADRQVAADASDGAPAPDGSPGPDGGPGDGATCTPEGNAAFCERLQKNCGDVSGTDNCGTPRPAVSCGTTCPTPQTCGADHVCTGGSAGTYALPADRATTWRPGVTHGGSGIPARTQVCATVPPGSGDRTSAIQDAIDSCPEGQVVQLTAGTYTCNVLLLIAKGITLRGAGAGQTIIQKTNGAVFGDYDPPDPSPNLVIGPNRWPWPDEATSQDLTADGVKGTTSVTVMDASGFAAGQFVLVDEESNAAFRPDPLGRGQIYASDDWRVVWWYHDPHGPSDDPVGGGAEGWFSRAYRVTTEVKEIASVSGDTITFTTPLHISYRAANRAQVTGYGSNAHIRDAGVEGITFTGGANGGVRFETAAYSWARNIEVDTWLGEGVAFENSFRCEVRDSYIHDAAWPVPGGGGYALSLSGGSAEILIENNISMMANKVMVARASGAGSVVGYNYADDGFIGMDGLAGWVEVGINGSHMVGPHHMLFEGNYSFNFDSDRTHGSSIYHTVFRNWLTGFRRPYTNVLAGDVAQNDLTDGAGPRRCIGANAYSYWMSFVGNVLGVDGQMSGWEVDATGTAAWTNTSAIWMLGWDAEDPYPYDPQVAATAVRDGNYDFVNREQRWITSSAATLPDSLYLTSKPAFFGAHPWPWVDPVTGTTYTLPAKLRFDDGTPNVVP